MVWTQDFALENSKRFKDLEKAKSGKGGDIANSLTFYREKVFFEPANSAMNTLTTFDLSSQVTSPSLQHLSSNYGDGRRHRNHNYVTSLSQ